MSYLTDGSHTMAAMNARFSFPCYLNSCSKHAPDGSVPTMGSAMAWSGRIWRASGVMLLPLWPFQANPDGEFSPNGKKYQSAARGVLRVELHPVHVHEA